MILRAHVAVFLAPVDLEETAAADLTQSLMGELVHTCSEPDAIVVIVARCFTTIIVIRNLRMTWPTRCADFSSCLQSFCSSGTHLALRTTRRAVGEKEQGLIEGFSQTTFFFSPAAAKISCTEQNTYNPNGIQCGPLMNPCDGARCVAASQLASATMKACDVVQRTFPANSRVLVTDNLAANLLAEASQCTRHT